MCEFKMHDYFLGPPSTVIANIKSDIARTNLVPAKATFLELKLLDEFEVI
jgi:hypothetical protein